MQYNKLGVKISGKLSILGFGLMRLPTMPDNHEKVDEDLAEQMFLDCVQEGINYFDTAYPYHKGFSEVFLGNMLMKHNLRDKIYIASKLPSWLINAGEDCDRYFNEQLEKLRTDSIDFYLLHALNKKHWERFKELGVLQWAEQKKKEGRIRYFGFSFHDEYQTFEDIINGYEHWDFCQIQYNYMDEDRQATTRGLELAYNKGTGVIVMEPLLGGSLATPPPQVQQLWDKAETKRSPVEWALQWLWDKKEVGLVLSGMSNLEQVKENIAIVNKAKPGLLSAADLALVKEVKEKYKKIRPIPCTACGYCQPCPQGINIPGILEIYNEGKIYQQPGRAGWIYNFGINDQPNGASCIRCGECESKCPQSIKIMDSLEMIHKELVKKEG